MSNHSVECEDMKLQKPGKSSMAHWTNFKGKNRFVCFGYLMTSYLPQKHIIMSFFLLTVLFPLTAYLTAMQYEFYV